jgi:SPW repeat-containing protein
MNRGAGRAGPGKPEGDRAMKNWRRESILDFYNLLLALFLLVSPWLFLKGSGKATTDLWASSAAIAAISLAAMVAFSYWEEWTNLALGIWLILSPWLLGFAHTSAMHFSTIVGAAVAFLSALELWLLYDEDNTTRTPSSANTPAPPFDDKR